MKLSCHITYFICCILCLSKSFAQEIYPRDSSSTRFKPNNPIYSTIGINGFHENDVLHVISENADDNYTGGFHFRLSSNWSGLNIPVPFIRKDSIWQQFHNIGVGTVAFTPQDIARRTVITDDRPYSSFQFLSYSIRTVPKNLNSIVDLEIHIGEMGGDFARDFQIKSHSEHWFGSTRPVPQGWPNQIANGGALGYNFHASYYRYLFEYYDGQHNWFDNRYKSDRDFKPFYLAALADVNLGNVNSNAALGLQIGLLSYNSFFGFNNAIDLVPMVHAEADKKWYNHISASLILTPRIRYVFHNAHLTGKYLAQESIYTVDTDQLNLILLEYDATLSLSIPLHDSFFINGGYGLSGRSKEFSYQNKDLHNWGSVQLGLNYIL